MCKRESCSALEERSAGRGQGRDLAGHIVHPSSMFELQCNAASVNRDSCAGVCYAKCQAAAVNPRAVTEMMVSVADQVFMVWPTVILKYSLTSQKPPSLTCEKMSAPAPVAMASNSGCTPVLCNAMGATLLAAVAMATVDDPVARRMAAANN